MREKCSKRFFENFHRFGHFGQKLSKMALFGLNDQKWFFAFFSRPMHQNFLIFCSKHSLWSRKIHTFSLFGGNLKMALFGQNWPKFYLNLAGCWNSWKSQKNKKVGVFETDFKQVLFVFRQTTCTYSESWRPVENLFDYSKTILAIFWCLFWLFRGPPELYILVV